MKEWDFFWKNLFLRKSSFLQNTLTEYYVRPQLMFYLKHVCPPLTFVWFVIQRNLQMSLFVVKTIESTTLLGQLKFVELLELYGETGEQELCLSSYKLCIDHCIGLNILVSTVN